MELEAELEKVEKLAGGTKLDRLAHDPPRYLMSVVFSHLLYPLTHIPLKRKAMTFFGAPIQLQLPAATDIFLTGGKTHPSEIKLARWMINNIHQGDRVIDIGAHYGYFSLLGAVLTGATGKILAIEASPSTYPVLQENIASHPQIESFQLALSNAKGYIHFYQFPTLYSEYNGLDIEAHRNSSWFKRFPPQVVEVKTTTLDRVVNYTQWGPQFIKMDVEGAEELVVLGGQETIARFKPIIVMEYLAGKGADSSYKRAVEMMEKAGYKTCILQNNGNPAPCTDIDKFLTDNNLDSENILFIPQS